jgi:hypothetical protein
MKHPTLIPIYAHLLCNEDLSEEAEDVAQHLFQRTVDAGLLRHDEGDEGSEPCSEPCSEPTMMRLLKASATTADVELRRLADRLEALLLQEFPARLSRH